MAVNNGVNVIWISWQRHRRTEGLASRLNIDLYVFESRLNRLLKHPWFCLRTLLLLSRVKPETLIVQNPSLILTLLTVFVKPIFNYKLIVDAHNIGVYRFPESNFIFDILYKFVHKYSDFTVVTNASLSRIIEINGGRPLILPDNIPDLSSRFKITSGPLDHKNNVVFICSFSPDEPYLNVFEAFCQLGDDYHLFVTGKFEKVVGIDRYFECSNITFTGFVSEQKYIDLLGRSDLVIDLTEMDDCLVCGSYEAISLGVPLLLSDTTANRNYFKSVIPLSLHDIYSIKKSVVRTVNDSDKLRNSIIELRENLKHDWEDKFSLLCEKII
jgi:glycosyltransferase involved in cell wall biosynthesis